MNRKYAGQMGVERMPKGNLTAEPSKTRGKTRISIDRELCLGCGTCINPCPLQGITLADGRAQCIIDETSCRHCLNCVCSCPEQAITVSPLRNGAQPEAPDSSRGTALLGELRAIVGAQNVHEDIAIADDSRVSGRIHYLVFPSTHEEVESTVHLANRHEARICAVGGKTATTGTYSDAEIGVHLGRLPNIELFLRDTEPYVRVGGGVQVGKLKSILRQRGFDITFRRRPPP